MKKISALLAIVMLLSAFVFAFSSCSPALTVGSVQNDPVKALNEAFNKSNAEFFKDDTGIIDVIAQSLNKGSVNISADLTQLVMSPVKFDMTAYNDGNSKKSSLNLNVTIGEENISGKVFLNSDGLIYSSEDLFGTAQAYLFNPETIASSLAGSALGNVLGSNAEVLRETAEEYAKILKQWKESSIEKSNENTKKLLEALNYTVNDAGENVAIELNINNETFAKAFDLIIDQVYANESDKASIKEQFNAILNSAETELNIDVKAAYFILKNGGMLDKIKINGDIGIENSGVALDMEYSVNAEKISIFANAKSVSGSVETDIFNLNIETVKTKTDATVKYTTTASMKSGNTTINIGSITFEHNNSEGKYKLELTLAKELFGYTENMTVSVSGDAKREGGKVTLTVSKISAPALLNGSDLTLDIKLVFDKDAKLPEFPNDAKDILTLSEKEITDILNAISQVIPK